MINTDTQRTIQRSSSWAINYKETKVNGELRREVSVTVTITDLKTAGRDNAGGADGCRAFFMIFCIFHLITFLLLGACLRLTSVQHLHFILILILTFYNYGKQKFAHTANIEPRKK